MPTATKTKPAHIVLIKLGLIGLVALLATGSESQAGPAPVINSVAPPQLQLTDETQDTQPTLLPATTTTPQDSSGADDKQQAAAVEINHGKELSSKAQQLALINGDDNGGGGGANGGSSSKSLHVASMVHLARSPLSANSEKLRRGLTNFMNNLNPAQFFVPQQQQQQTLALGKTKGSPAAAAANTQAEPATIINDRPTASALIKGPNRLVQSRPLGGPLRWGRRR